MIHRVPLGEFLLDAVATCFATYAGADAAIRGDWLTTVSYWALALAFATRVSDSWRGRETTDAHHD